MTVELRKKLSLRNVQPYDIVPCILVTADDLQPVTLPYKTRTFRDEPMTIVAFQPPRYTPLGQPIRGGDGMNGYVTTSDGARYYPSVAGLKILTQDEYDAVTNHG